MTCRVSSRLALFRKVLHEIVSQPGTQIVSLAAWNCLCRKFPFKFYVEELTFSTTEFRKIEFTRNNEVTVRVSRAMCKYICSSTVPRSFDYLLIHFSRIPDSKSVLHKNRSSPSSWFLWICFVPKFLEFSTCSSRANDPIFCPRNRHCYTRHTTNRDSAHGKNYEHLQDVIRSFVLRIWELVR